MDNLPVPGAWKTIPILECGEAIVPIPSRFIPEAPHPYMEIGAPYPEGFSPYMLRQRAAEALVLAQQYLLEECVKAGLPPLFLKVYDALRPIEVQKFMAERAARDLAPQYGFDPDNLTDDQMTFLLKENVHWAAPSEDPGTPPPHSTGGTMDVYVIDAHGEIVDMGEKHDAGGDLAVMNAFNSAHDPQGQLYHRRRLVLKGALEQAGFMHNPYEWYHYDFKGTQRAAYLMRLWNIDPKAAAVYGRADLALKKAA